MATVLKTYYTLTKPGIIFGNAVTACGGFFLAAKGCVDPLLFFNMLVGLSLVIASACVCNNYIDRKIDEKMQRTQNRAFVTGAVTVQAAFVFAFALLLSGELLLSVYVNQLAADMAMVGFFVYVVLYGFSKYQTSLATLIGSVAGAIPPVVGYTAVGGGLDLGSLLMFLIVVTWQMPHFYAIALYRYDDYAAASIPVLPIEKGAFATKVQMALYIASFIVVSSLLTICGYTGYSYMAVSTLLGLRWLWMALQGFSTDDDTRWARKMFLFSLVVICALCFMSSIDWVM